MPETPGNYRTRAIACRRVLEKQLENEGQTHRVCWGLLTVS
jgi:hypothetical protein